MKKKLFILCLTVALAAMSCSTNTDSQQTSKKEDKTSEESISVAPTNSTQLDNTQSSEHKEKGTESENLTAKVTIAAVDGSKDSTSSQQLTKEELIATGNLVKIENGDQIDLNGDGKSEKISLSVNSSDGFATGFELTVNDKTLEHAAEEPIGEIYVAALMGNDYPYVLLIPENGASCDYASHLCYYDNDKLIEFGIVPGLPESMKITDDGTLETTIRGKSLQTWFHKQEYAVTLSYDSNYLETPYLAMIPEDFYYMGTVVTLKADIPLMKSRDNTDIITTLPSGTTAIIVGSDDEEYLYLQSSDNEMSGWLKFKDYDQCLINGNEISVSDLFDGLIFAD